MTSPFEEYESLIIPCDCGEEACATWLELTPHGILAIEDADGLLLSIDLPEWLDDAMRSAMEAQAADAHVNQPLASTELSVWPEPTVEEPDLETLADWIYEGGGCEATDGCWIEEDGTCVHGHPSWLLALGLI